MQNQIRTVFLLSAILIFSGCKKDEFTQPTSFQLKFQADYGVGINGVYSEEVIMSPRRVEIIGQRPVADNVYLSRDYQQVKWECDEYYQPVETFDIPQGDYDVIDFTMTWKNDPDLEADVDKELDDWYDKYEAKFIGRAIEEYLEADADEYPALMLVGKVKLEDIYLIVFAKNDTPFTITGRSQQGSGGSSSVVLQEGRMNYGQFHMKSIEWMDVLTTTDLNNAVKGYSDDRNMNVILLHRRMNTALYNKVLNKITETTEVTIK